MTGMALVQNYHRTLVRSKARSRQFCCAPRRRLRWRTAFCAPCAPAPLPPDRGRVPCRHEQLWKDPTRLGARLRAAPHLRAQRMQRPQGGRARKGEDWELAHACAKEMQDAQRKVRGRGQCDGVRSRYKARPCSGNAKSVAVSRGDYGDPSDSWSQAGLTGGRDTVLISNRNPSFKKSHTLAHALDTMCLRWPDCLRRRGGCGGGEAERGLWRREAERVCWARSSRATSL